MERNQDSEREEDETPHETTDDFEGNLYPDTADSDRPGKRPKAERKGKWTVRMIDATQQKHYRALGLCSHS